MKMRDSRHLSPALAKAIDQVERLDPLLVDAADDVDPGLQRYYLGLTPLERLRACSRAAATLAKLRREPSPHR